MLVGLAFALAAFALPVAATTASAAAAAAGTVLTLAVALGALGIWLPRALVAIAPVIDFLVVEIGLGLILALILVIVDNRCGNSLRRDRARPAALDRHPRAFERFVDHYLDRDAIARLDLGQFATFAVEQINCRFAPGAKQDPVAAATPRFFLDDPQRTQT